MRRSRKKVRNSESRQAGIPGSTQGPQQGDGHGCKEKPVMRLSRTSTPSEEIRQAPKQYLLSIYYIPNIILLNPLKFPRCHPYFIIDG